MFFSKERKAKRLEQLIAGKMARLEALKKLTDRAEEIPGNMAMELLLLPQQIAELEVALNQTIGTGEKE